MSIKIAVFFDENNKISSIFNPSIVKILEKGENKWVATKEFPIYLDMKKGILVFREQLSELISQINGVKVVVASEISGIPYNVMDKEGFDICENMEFSEDLLDSILEAKNTDLSCCQVNDSDDIEIVPIETQISGNYYFDLKKLLAKKSSLTSKQALLPFLKNVPFHVLEVLCSHIPPWFDVEFQRFHLEQEVIKISENNYIVRITKKTCDE